MEQAVLDKGLQKVMQRITVGCLICLAVMLVAYMALGQLTTGVVLGGVIGTAYGIFNMYSLAMSLQRASTMSGSEAEIELAKKQVNSSRIFRMLGLFGVCALCFLLPFTEGMPCVIAQLFYRITLFFLQITGQAGKLVE